MGRGSVAAELGAPPGNRNGSMERPHDLSARRRERAAFLILTAVVFPLMAVIIVAGYGFLVWIWQMFTGPPGGP